MGWNKVLLFLVNGQYFKDYHNILETLGLDHVSSTQWTHVIEWIAPFVKMIADWSVQEARTEAVRRGDKSSLYIQFDGFYLNRGHFSNNSSATVHDAKTGKITAYSHRTKRGQGANWEGTSGGAACVKECSKKHYFHSHFFNFYYKPKRMPKFLQNGF